MVRVRLLPLPVSAHIRFVPQEPEATVWAERVMLINKQNKREKSECFILFNYLKIS
jgi:hypothetical protein